MTIIKIDTNNGHHPIEFQSHRNDCWLDGYIIVPSNLENKAWESRGWCDLDIIDGVLVDIIPTEQPPEPESPNTSDLAEIQLATSFMLASCTTYTDDQALQIKSVFSVWPDGVNTDGKYAKGQYITHNDQLYHIEQGVQPIESQPPDAEGMLAIYRPIDIEHEGTLDDPIPWVYGMNCYAGKYYSYNGNIYKVAVGGDMIPCTWEPGTAGMWQWELVSEKSSQPNDDVQY